MNLKRVIIGLGTAIVLLAFVSGLSWFVTDHQALTQNAQSTPTLPPIERTVSHHAN